MQKEQLHMAAVIGAGGIGRDMAYWLANATGGKMPVVLVDISEEARTAARNHYVEMARENGKRAGRKGQDVEAAVSKVIRVASAIRITGDISEVSGACLVIEAATENLPLKKRILADVERVVGREAIIGFTTSGIPRRLIVSGAQYPDRCFVMHPFYPAWRNPGLEIVASDDLELTDEVVRLITDLGKVPVLVADIECFAGNAIFTPLINVALKLVEAGVATVAQVNAIMATYLGGGGVFTVHDLIPGNANLLTAECLDRIADTWGGEWFRPCRTLREAATDGRTWLTVKEDTTFSDAQQQTVMDAVHAAIFGISVELVEQEVVSAFHLNWLTRVSLAFRKGVFEMMDELGNGEVRRLLGSAFRDDADHPVPQCVLQGNRLPTTLTDVHLHIDEETGVATVTVFRPEVLNAMRSRTVEELTRLLDTLQYNSSVIGVIFTGFGGSLAGADVNELAACTTPEAMADFTRKGQALTIKLQRFPKPTIAVVNGVCFGGGCEMAMACSQRLVGPNSLIGQPEVKLGIIPGWGGTVRLMRLVGVDNALRMLRTGNGVTGRIAATYGWCGLAEGIDLLEEARRILARITSDGAALNTMSEQPMTEVPELEPFTVDIGANSTAVDGVLVPTVMRNMALSVEDGLANEAAAMAMIARLDDCRIGLENFLHNGPRVPARFVNS